MGGRRKERGIHLFICLSCSGSEFLCYINTMQHIHLILCITTLTLKTPFYLCCFFVFFARRIIQSTMCVLASVCVFYPRLSRIPSWTACSSWAQTELPILTRPHQPHGLAGLVWLCRGWTTCFIPQLGTDCLHSPLLVFQLEWSAF